VRWKRSDGAVRVALRTQTVPELDAEGLIREGFLDLSDEAGSLDNANQAGDQWLAEHLRPSADGRITIARPILDRTTGRMTPPWALRAGQLIQVQGVQKPVGFLDSAQRDGATVFRIVSKEYSVATAAATLELDTFSVSTARALADLQRRSTRRR
jgi:hypothetical protein